jgi:hypothetical protein
VRDVSGDSDRFRRAVGLARTSLGVVSLGELLALDIPETTVRSWVRAGRLIRLHRGVYAVGHDALRREARWRAALLAYGADAVLSHATAAVRLELQSWSGRLIDVTVPRGRRRRPGIRVHQSSHLPAGDVMSSELLRVTSPTRTILDMARSCRPSDVENAAAVAERRGLLDLGRIDAEGTPDLRRMLGRGPKLVRARIERRFLDGLRAAGVAEPEANVWLTHGGGEQWQPDFVFWPQRVIVELDDDSHRTAKAFELDRLKDAVRQVDGWATLRFSLRRVDDDLPRVLAELTAVLARRNRS